uniref:hypothetical protein n=1 Tax=Undibacterium sp. TaxID=1914977 RepID=UPI00374FE20A
LEGKQNLRPGVPVKERAEGDSKVKGGAKDEGGEKKSAEGATTPAASAASAQQPLLQRHRLLRLLQRVLHPKFLS